MYCTNPGFIARFGYVPCGKCEACKIAKKKELSDRLQIEAKYHMHNYFVTLTYRPEIQPVSVVKDDLIKFNKRLAYYCGGMPQFYAVGEYGDESALAHYHLAIFSDEDIFDNILKSWDFGRVGIEHLVPERCKYIAGYVAKKLNKPDDPRLYGRQPEFRMCSRRPALGFSFLYELLERFVTDEKFKQIMLSHIYPPYSLRMGGKKISVPRYVRDKLRPLYNGLEKEQFQKRQEKKFKDTLISQKIEENVQRMLELEGLVSPYADIQKWHVQDRLKELRKERDNHLKKVSELHKKWKL